MGAACVFAIFSNVFFSGIPVLVGLLWRAPLRDKLCCTHVPFECPFGFGFPADFDRISYGFVSALDSGFSNCAPMLVGLAIHTGVLLGWLPNLFELTSSRTYAMHVC